MTANPQERRPRVTYHLDEYSPLDNVQAVVYPCRRAVTARDSAIQLRRMIYGEEGDAQALKTLPRERLDLGTSEIRNWIAAAGAMESMTPHFIGDYIPAYRSVAGTGCGMSFAYWD